jgi:hypothetical protein
VELDVVGEVLCLPDRTKAVVGVGPTPIPGVGVANPPTGQLDELFGELPARSGQAGIHHIGWLTGGENAIELGA